MADELIYLNGIDGDSGTYLTPPLSFDALTQLALGESGDSTFQKEVEDKGWTRKSKVLAVNWDVNPTLLEEAGWGVIFARDADPQIQEALGELLDHRRAQANATQPLFRLYTGADGFQPDDTKAAWLERHGMGPGPAVPTKVPYYLLIVGSPAEIPYTFQYQLDLQYAVGRIHFDTPAEYARYARSVVEAESGKLQLPRRVAFFGTQNPDDPATDLSSKYLVKPLADNLQAAPALSKWSFSTTLGADATKARALQLLGGSDTPAVLFTASHGMAFHNTNPGQREHQGALLCQDYPGPLQWQGSIPQTFYFAGEDLARDANVFGLISFHVACYGAGTPQVNDFPYLGATSQDSIPAQPFVARLPQRLLGHPNGGALAAISHVERAWGYSFFWDQAGQQTAVFESVLGQIMRGLPVGYALDFMNGRYAELAADLGAMMNTIKVDHKTPDDHALAELWTANNDARSYILLGDPAVRLSLGDASTPPAARATITLDNLPVAPAPPPTPAAPAAASLAVPPAPSGAVNMGITDDLQNTFVALRGSVQTFANSLGAMLQQAVDDVTQFQVATYVSDDMGHVTYAQGKLNGDFELRALTAMKLQGDTLVCVPRRAGQVDEQLWKIHTDMVGQAQAYRTELLKAAVSAASGLLDILKPQV